MCDLEIPARISITVLAIFLVVVLALSGCSGDNPYVDAWNEGVAIAESMLAEDAYYQEHYVSEYFEQVATDRNFPFVLYRDLRTDVMYVKYIYSGYQKGGASFSVMYAADGSPLLYSEWLALGTDQEVSGDD